MAKADRAQTRKWQGKKNKQRKSTISKVQEAFESDVFVPPDLRLMVTFCRPVCLSLGDKESKLCPRLLSLKLHLTKVFYVSAASVVCLGQKLLKRKCSRASTGQGNMEIVQPSRRACTQKKCLKRGFILKENPSGNMFWNSLRSLCWERESETTRGDEEVRRSCRSKLQGRYCLLSSFIVSLLGSALLAQSAALVTDKGEKGTSEENGLKSLSVNRFYIASRWLAKKKA